MLAYVAYLRFTIHQIGTALFATGGTLIVGYFAATYFRDARRLRATRSAKNEKA
jgi:hypothetical protein